MIKYIAIILALAAAWVATQPGPVPTPLFGGETTAKVRCQEDMPCWTWSTMGNHQRGIVTKSLGRVVVHPSGFCAALRAHDIDWSKTKPLKGDPACGRT